MYKYTSILVDAVVTREPASDSWNVSDWWNTHTHTHTHTHTNAPRFWSLALSARLGEEWSVVC
jgi:hypothetical protein